MKCKRCGAHYAGNPDRRGSKKSTCPFCGCVNDVCSVAVKVVQRNILTGVWETKSF